MSDIAITEHAILRYRERVVPGLDWKACKAQLETLVRSTPLSRTPPPWVHTTQPDTEGFLVLADGICGLVAHRAVITVVIRGGHSEEVRAGKRKRRAHKRHARSLKRKGLPGPRRPERAESWAD